MAEECAVSFRSKDVADLKEKLEMLLARPDLVKHYEEKARAHVRHQYSWDKVTESVEAVYLSLLAGRT